MLSREILSVFHKEQCIHSETVLFLSETVLRPIKWSTTAHIFHCAHNPEPIYCSNHSKHMKCRHRSLQFMMLQAYVLNINVIKKKRRQGWRRNERKQGRKEPAGQPQCNLEKIHISKNTRQRLLLRRNRGQLRRSNYRRKHRTQMRFSTLPI